MFGINVLLKLNQNGECDYIDLNQWRPRDSTDVYLQYFLAFDEMNKTVRRGLRIFVRTGVRCIR